MGLTIYYKWGVRKHPTRAGRFCSGFDVWMKILWELWCGMVRNQGDWRPRDRLCGRLDRSFWCWGWKLGKLNAARSCKWPKWVADRGIRMMWRVVRFQRVWRAAGCGFALSLGFMRRLAVFEDLSRSCVWGRLSLMWPSMEGEMGVRFDSPTPKTAQNEDRVDVLFTRKINCSEYVHGSAGKERSFVKIILICLVSKSWLGLISSFLYYCSTRHLHHFLHLLRYTN